MAENQSICDKVREETLQILELLEPGSDSIIAYGNYYKLVDDQSGANNYAHLLKEETRAFKKMSNTKLWNPIHAQTNLDNLTNQLGLDWHSKSMGKLRHMKNMFDDIDASFQKKGLKPAGIPGGIPRYEPRKSPVRRAQTSSSSEIHTADEDHNPILDDERLKNIDKQIAKRILNEVVDQKHQTKWDDIAGLENVKQAINEIVVYPMQNPELFQGLLAPAKGLLLFGPPGTGKTLIGKCIASESGATFFAISASSLTSKWVGEGEKMVRALFAVARCMQPSVVFIDEIDSLLTQRTDGEHDSTRRLKTEFLVQFDGVSTASNDRLLIVGATNRPGELDDAARRRFTKRIYIPLPDEQARIQIVRNLMAAGKSSLTEECVQYIADRTEGFSGADMATLCKESALNSVRAVIRARGSARDLASQDVPPIQRVDFDNALKHVKASVSGNDLGIYEDFDRKFGVSREGAGSTQGS